MCWVRCKIPKATKCVWLCKCLLMFYKFSRHLSVCGIILRFFFASLYSALSYDLRLARSPFCENPLALSYDIRKKSWKVLFEFVEHKCCLLVLFKFRLSSYFNIHKYVFVQWMCIWTQQRGNMIFFHGNWSVYW